jgi:glycosyltransferase involved in cell wall biosynthesis
MIMPTDFIEPFGGSAVEAQLCGTPVITTNFGAFMETVDQGRSGFRCNTLGDLLYGVDHAGELGRGSIAARARALYSLETCGKQYDSVLNQVADLAESGWYTETSRWFGGA